MRVRSVALLASLALVVAACAGASSPATRDGAAPPAAATAATAATARAVATAGATAARPAFLTIPLTDVRTGERFTLGGFPGKVTFFIAMAVW